MRILSIHNEYLIKGGEGESRRAEVAILEKYGNSVVSYVENNTKVAALSNVSVGLRTLWSNEAYSYVRKLLKEQKFDVVHVQNFFPLISPSVYYAAQAEGVPVVQSVRNYRFLCPNSLLYRDGHVCELCLKKTAKIPAIQHNCYRGNKAASATAASMLWLHNQLPTWSKIDRFISVSEFVKAKMVEGGFPANKITVKPNFVFPDPGLSAGKENYIVYVGRLQAEKGILLLLKAIPKLPTSIRVKIIGEGPLVPEVMALAENYNVDYLGKLPLTDTYEVIGKAQALVIPSVWYEPFGRVVVEAYAKGTAVIGSRMGGIPELIDDEITGYIFENDSVEDLVEKIHRVLSNKDMAIQMGLRGRAKYLNEFTPESNYEQLMAIYNDVVR
ncbi:glycosyltransferase family 4 protein [Spirosoma montaniterrae]|uniref:Glycosyl transferase family 1 n=1 Tax=Spirosoma montaniterrae TaxID=1178516 RepID=A0A1P9X192_9BACT|nr:glycosyltransferase family 4 protein [Spirosoma montaniterrae]AQG81394.1 hypothetical protein AWR27_19955 [Spirosoma montaniterrae]